VTDFSKLSPTPNARLDAILARFARAGFARREPRLLQPSGVFLDRLGENFRGQLYLVSDASGAELCLRPEYTIPVCLEYLTGPQAGAPANYAYGGPIFSGPDGEAVQAGLESFGRDDPAAADAEILAVALEAAVDAGAGALNVRLGDAGLVTALLDSLPLAPVWRRRLETGFARGQALEAILAPPRRDESARHAGVLAALEKSDPGEARKLVEDLLSLAGITTVGGRSAGEIAERFLDQATLAGGVGLSDAQRRLLADFFAIEGAPDAAARDMRRLAQAAGLDLSAALDAFETRASFIAARGLALDEMRFSVGFARRLDYYSGFVFEARPSGAAAALIAGGRYDRLLKTLGAAQDIPAVGAAIYVDRLQGASA
jgi:ATP phosphoribosyltransferase regulatory subunit